MPVKSKFINLNNNSKFISVDLELQQPNVNVCP